MKTDYDVGIIGGSLAGAVAAWQIGQCGYNVLLLDKSEFPRSKACGEGLSTFGINILNKIGLGGVLKCLPTQPYNGYAVRGEIGHTLTIDTEFKTGVGIERNHLDAAILNDVLKLKSVHVHLGNRVTAIEATKSDEKLPNFTLHTESGNVSTRFLVIADGASSMSSEKLEIHRKRPKRVRHGITLHSRGAFKGESLKQVQVFLRDNCEVCCTPLVDGRLNCSVFYNDSPVTNPGRSSSWKHFIERLWEEIGYEGEIEEPILAAGTIGGSVRPAYAKRALLVGDACEQLDPIGGMGMSHAIVSGKLAGDALVSVLSEEYSADDAFKRYAVERNEFARPLRGFTRLCYGTLVKKPQKQFLYRVLPRSLGREVATSVHGLNNSCFSPFTVAFLSMLGL